MNKTQLQTTVASLVGIVAGYLAGKNVLGLSLSDWTTILTALVTAGALVGPAVFTRVQALKDTVGKSGAKVVTTAESANALPNNPNVIAETPAIATAVKAASA